MLQIADRIAALNEDALKRGDSQLGALFGRLQLGLVAMIVITLLGAATLAALTIFHILRLEGEVQERLKESVQARAGLQELSAKLVRALCAAAKKRKMRVRVGGGIRTVAQAARIAGWGAEKIIVGSAAFKDGKVNATFLRRLAGKIGRRRVMIALDTEGGKILVRGWQDKLRLRPEEVIPQFEKYASEFLCTYVDAEGTMRGTNLEWFRSLRRATRRPITAAGGIRSREEIRALARIKMDAAVGMALYTGKIRG